MRRGRILRRGGRKEEEEEKGRNQVGRREGGKEGG